MSRVTRETLPVVTAKPGHIHIKWPDGSESAIPNREVRASCQCAQCIHEFTGEQILDPASVSHAIEAKSIATLGNYAVSIAWSDGHASGIFTWDHLRGLTQKAA